METHELSELISIPFSKDIDDDNYDTPISEMVDMRNDPGFYVESHRFECTCGASFDTEEEAREHKEEETGET